MEDRGRPAPGPRGLSGSQHHRPNAPSPLRRTHPAQDDTEETETIRGLLNGLVNLAPADKKHTAQGLAREITSLFYNQAPKAHETITTANLKKVVTEAVQAAVGEARGAPQARSWATVAAGAPAPAQQGLPTKAIPQRINREILVRGNNLPADLKTYPPRNHPGN